MRCVGLTAGLAAACVLLSLPATGADTGSTAYQMNAAHDGRIVMSPSFKPPLRKVWSRDLGGSVSYPVVANGLVFVAVANKTFYGTQLYALDMRTGATVWQKPMGGPYFWSAHAYDDGRLFVLDFNGVLQAFKADRKGKRDWTAYLHVMLSELVASNGKVFVGGPNGSAIAVNQNNGAVAWKVSVKGADSSPATDGAGVYLGYVCQYYKFDIATGNQLWNSNTGCQGGGDSKPVYYDNHVFVRDWASGNWVLDASSGSRSNKGFSSDQSPTFWKSTAGQVSMITYNLDGPRPHITSIDLNSRSENWTFVPGGNDWATTAPVVINDMVAVGSAFGVIYLLDAANGHVLWSANVGAAIRDNGEDGFQQTGGYARPYSGLGAGSDMLFVPASNTLVAFAP